MIIEDISYNVQEGMDDVTAKLVAQALEEGISAEDILYKGLIGGISVIGELFKNNEVFVPEVLISARAMNAGMDILKPYLAAEGIKNIGKACIGTVKGDLHDIGKNLVKMLMEGKGFEVIDLGTDVPAEKFVRVAKEENCQLICCSALLTTTMHVIGEVVEKAVEEGIRDKVRILIGGAPITEEFRELIKADGYTPDAARAADMAVELVKELS